GYYYMKRFAVEMGDRMQFFLDEEGQSDFVCMTRVAGAKLHISYKGAYATRPDDEMDVDEFIGIKSHRAKGKRLTTYDINKVIFIEPEVEEDEEPETEVDIDLEEPALDVLQPDSATPVEPARSEVEFEIERPRGDADQMIDPEQLNLF
ncbi:MAG: DNA gyrase/topoisomerase IV subunit A, partial [Alistipes sp.]